MGLGESANGVSPSLKESRHSFSEREGGMPISLSMKESHHSVSEREGEGQPSSEPAHPPPHGKVFKAKVKTKLQPQLADISLTAKLS